jgi:uncharacterized membrane protein
MRTALEYPDVRLSTSPLYATLVQFPVACFVGALLTDIAYVRTQQYLWASFSVWMLAFGCVCAGIAGLVGLFIFVRNGRVRAAPMAWPHAVVSLAAALLAVVNTFVHSRDGYTSVMPTGLTLSAIVVFLMLVATALGWTNHHRHVTTVRGEPA